MAQVLTKVLLCHNLGYENENLGQCIVKGFHISFLHIGGGLLLVPFLVQCSWAISTVAFMSAVSLSTAGFFE